MKISAYLKKIFQLVLLLSINILFSQENEKEVFWEEISELKSSRFNNLEVSTNSKLFKVNLVRLKQKLNLAPKRGQNLTLKSELILYFPNSSGVLNSFRVIEASVMSKELQSKFPNIRSYAGQGIDDPSSIIRFSISEKKGITSMERSTGNGVSYIEAYSVEDNLFNVFSELKDVKSKFNCDTEEHLTNKVKSNSKSSLKDADEGVLHTFRLALSCTGEYGSGVGGGTVEGVMSEFNATMTRVNGIFENDFASTMVLISNESDIIYFNPNTDPYSSGLNLSDELQSNLTNVIGENNYDIGHVFNQAGNDGYADCIGCLCENGRKGSAYTQSTLPKGVNFDVDYVAHEMGHQFGGSHTFTHRDDSNIGANLEPGSGSTIMGYAGITGSTDVQQNSDPYFHFFTIEQVTTHVSSRTCDVESVLTQDTPTVNAGSDYTIPAGTPFRLTGSGTVDSSGLITYCWEQNDIGGPSNTFPSPSTSTGPSFRSLEPSLSPTRYLPMLPVVLNGSLGEEGDWEVINNVSRDYSFKLTVRDNIVGGGQNKIDEMSVSVDDAFGPFQVTSQEVTTSWDVGTTQIITWDVASTNSGAVSAKKINILFTDDQGLSFTALASGVDNDGSHEIVVPSIITNSGRIMVEAADNIFFAVNSGLITIKEVQFVLDFQDDTKDLCSGEDKIEFQFTHKTFLGYNETTSFSVLNKPQGTTVTFNPTNSSTDGEIIIMTISGVSSMNIGENIIVVEGISSDTNIVFDYSVLLNVINEDLDKPSLIFPSENEINVQQPINFSWENNLDVEIFEIEIFDNEDALGSPIETASITTNNFVGSLLSDYTDYWWRIKGENKCGKSEFSNLFKFKTVDIDSDLDGILDYLDNCINTSNPNQEDSDENGIGDACQDIDGDGVIDIEDNCVNISNPNQEDSDENGIGDICQDTDGDGVIDIEDNCVLTVNPNQLDENNDGIGDLCDTPIPADTITPNGDMVNDTWNIQNIEYVTNNVKVFNRYGVEVFEAKNYTNRTWGGNSNKGGSGLLPAGSYYYVINYVTVNGDSKSVNGWLYINY
jgi:gliding motility-associated-like protein